MPHYRDKSVGLINGSTEMGMSDSDRERILDNMVQRRLQTDRAYLNAENSEQQAEREAEIEAQCERELEHAAWLRLLEMARL